ncbi:MAG: hypothetical protein K0R41_1424 [Geminicoccaceae bacterium]|nr:hypothetical protein [Geminicoccaceae bacterium]MDF2757851.1 hypothetical protein [Thermomicrobiales bacterium]MDF3015357.1 hypothetical protein [Thermomicrobiales bacterium]
MRAMRFAAAGAALALNVGVAEAADFPVAGNPAGTFPIELPPLADAILNGNTSNLDPVLIEALSGDYSFALGVSIGSAFSGENIALAETFTTGIALIQGPGSTTATALARAFADPELARVLAWVEAQAGRPQPVSPD